jgi:crotonobetainyl-CoA:carnitine CoA-transferase CaiB-like acyl-CoA transferase
VTHIPHYGLFPCAGGGWISIGIVHEDHFWQRFCAVAGLDHLAALKFSQRLERAEEVREALQRVLLSRTSADWETALVKADVPAAAVVKLSEVFESPQFKARGLFVDVDRRRYVAQPVRLSSGSIAPSKGPPSLDEHRDLIMAELEAQRPSKHLEGGEASGNTEGPAGI